MQRLKGIWRNTLDEFAGQVVLVTGAGRGIGRAISETFAAHGAIAAVNDLTPVNLDRTVARITAQGGRAKDYITDIAKRMPVQALVEQVLDDWGRIDVLVNNAGVEPQSALLDMDEWDWNRTIAVNLSGPFFAIQAAGRAMREQGGGVIINIAAVAGRAHGLKDRGAYIASKMGLIGLTREAAREFAPHGIRVNAICPGVIQLDTSRMHEAQARDVFSSPEGRPVGGENLRPPAPEIPQGRFGSPQDIADLALFLCSSAAVYITGQAINVDGGQVMC